jgi:hypothetical protein
MVTPLGGWRSATIQATETRSSVSSRYKKQFELLRTKNPSVNCLWSSRALVSLVPFRVPNFGALIFDSPRFSPNQS